MIPVALTRSKSRYSTPSFICRDCQKEFRVRHAGKRICVDCEDIRDTAKKRAMSRVKYAIETGRLARPNTFKCADCGGPSDRYEHRDYSKPLEVEPVCVRCNAARGRLHELPACQFLRPRLSAANQRAADSPVSPFLTSARNPLPLAQRTPACTQVPAVSI